MKVFSVFGKWLPTLVYKTYKKHIDKSTLYLKKGWQSTPRYDIENKSFYVGREDEVEQLSEWLKSDDGGTVLISGIRGVGKTTFVFESIRRSYEDNQVIYNSFLYKNNILGKIPTLVYGIHCLGKTFINRFLGLVIKNSVWRTVVLLDYSTVSLWKRDQDTLFGYKNVDEGKVVDSLIISLHNSDIYDKKTKRRINALYEFVKYESRKEVQNGLTQNFKIGISVPISIIALLYFSAKIFFPDIPLIVFKILELIFGIIVVSNFVYRFWFKSKSKRIAKSGQFSYKYNELLDILKDSEDEKFIFVIDELDKVGDEEEIDNIVKGFFRLFKNFILLSGSKFIFITDQTYYVKFQLGVSKDRYSLQTTYFNWKLFLSTLVGSDFEKFIEHYSYGFGDLSIINQEFGYNIFYESRGNFKKAKELLIEDYVNRDVIKTTSIEMKRRARLGKILDIFFKENPISRLSESIYKFQELELMFNIFDSVRGSSGFSGTLDELIQVDLITNDIDKTRSRAAAIQILEFIRDYSSETKLPVTIPIDNSNVFSFHLLDENICPDISGLNRKVDGLSVLERLLTEEVDKVSESARKYLEVVNETTNNYILGDKDGPLLDEIISFSKDINSALKDVGSKIMNTDQNKVAQYLNEITRIDKILNNKFHVYCYSIFVKLSLYEDDLVMSENHNGYTFMLRGRKVDVVKSTNNIVFINDISLGNIKDTRTYFSSMFNILVGELKIYQNTKTKQLVFNQSQVKYKSIWEYSAKQYLLLGKGSSFAFLRHLSMEIRTVNPYWRFGIGFGVSEKEVEPLDGNKYTLVHLFKDLEQSSIMLRSYTDERTMNKYGGNKYEDIMVSESELPSYKIKINYDEPLEKLSIELNGKIVKSIHILKSEMDKFVLLGWGDGNEYQIEVSNLNYTYDEYP